MSVRALAVLILAAFLPATSQAHEVRPAYLELRETAPERYRALLKVPAIGDRRLALNAVWPAACTVSGEPVTAFAGTAHIEYTTLDCTSGLAGSRVAIAGLEGSITEALVRIERLNGSVQTARLTPDAPALVVASAGGRAEVAGTYLAIGVEHILLGVDHLLFVLGLVFLAHSWRRLVATITAFTVAHSFTLAAAALGWVRLQQQPVEAVIALSIVFVGAEILRARAGRPGLATRRPWLVAFAFGLLHGFGFAGALGEVGLPAHAVPLALLFFNLGVEVGQLLFIAAVLALLASIDLALRHRRHAGPDRAAGRAASALAMPSAYVIGALAAYWTIDRTLALWA